MFSAWCPGSYLGPENKVVRISVTALFKKKRLKLHVDLGPMANRLILSNLLMCFVKQHQRSFCLVPFILLWLDSLW